MSDHTTSQANTGPAGAGAGPAAPRPTATPGQGFFDWVRRFGVKRGDAWIGGVCGGIAARLGIDPIIVRGIAVVVALLGGPAFLLYALGWLLLPDEAGTIHLQRLISGVFDAATAGVIVFALLAFLPLAQGVWWVAGWPYGGSAGLAGSVGKVFWSAVVIAAIVAVIVWASRRAGGWGASGWGAAPGEHAVPDPAPTGTDPAASAPRLTFDKAPETAPAPEPPAAPQPPMQGASASVVADWRAQQAEWKTRYDEWKRQQADVSRLHREQRSAEAVRQQEAAFERARIRRLTHPRASGPFVAIALGTALIVGALAAAVAWGIPSARDFQSAVGFAAATAVVGLAMVVAGLMRRSSGFLAFVAILLVVVTVGLLSFLTGTGPWFHGLPSFTFTY